MARVVTSKVAQLLETIYEENKDEIKRIPTHPFNIEKARLWVEAQPERYKLFAHLFLKYQIHVSGQEFLEALNRLGNDIQSRMVMGKYTGIIVCSELTLDTDKSNFWVLLLLYPYIGRYLAAMAGDLVQCYDFILSRGGKDRYLVLIPDDMAYSGEQVSAVFMQEQFREVVEKAFDYEERDESRLDESKNFKYLRERYGKVCADTDILLASPYLATRAYDNLVSRASGLAKIFALEEFPLRFSEVSRPIFSLDKLMGKDGNIDVPSCVDRMDNNAIYFDHKLADYVSSFPSIYDYGVIAGQDGKELSHLGSLIKNCPKTRARCPEGFYKLISYTYLGKPISTRLLEAYVEDFGS